MRSLSFLRVASLLVLLAAAPTGAARATEYSLDPLRSTLLLRFGKFIITQALFYIRAIRAAKHLYLFFLKNFYWQVHCWQP